MSTSGETHKVENWAEYSDALVDRGRLTIWISEEAIQDWKADREPQQGAQWIFTDGAIETCLQIKMVYGLTLRETEGAHVQKLCKGEAGPICVMFLLCSETRGQDGLPPR